MSPRPDREYRSVGAVGTPAGGEAAGNRRLADVVRVRLDRSRRTGTYLAGKVAFQPGDQVVVEAERGTALGKVLEIHRKAWMKRSDKPFRVVRRFRDKDVNAQERQKWREKKFRTDCGEAAKAMGLDLKVADAEYLHWENRVIFYFVSEGRVDFRDLVRDLSRQMRCRVEMRQIGPRDETRLLGGVGTCGREFCCSTHLKQFDSIRIRMVKDQGLVMNPQKVSGGCGKLKCCLAYEVDVYKQLRKGMPGLGKLVQTPDGSGKVREVNVLSRKVGVLVEGAGYKTYPVALLCNRDGVPYDPEGKAAIEAEVAAEKARREALEQVIIAKPSPGSKGRDGRGDGKPQKKRSRRGRGRRGGGGGDARRKDGQPGRDRKQQPRKQGSGPKGGQGGRSDRPDQGRGEGPPKKKRRNRRRRRKPGGGGGGGGGGGAPQGSGGRGGGGGGRGGSGGGRGGSGGGAPPPKSSS